MIELNGIQLDKTSAVPLYEQLRKALLEAITSGKLSAGTKLPTEEELCAQFGISRPVARQAYNMLIEEGFLWNACGAAVLLCAAPIPVAAS